MARDEYDLQFLEAIHRKDEAGVQENLQAMVQPASHQARIDPPDPAGEAIFFVAAGYAKLAWMKGMNIVLNSPVVPSELLPRNPLNEYHDRYDFIKAFFK